MEQERINAVIDGQSVEVPAGTTVLEAAHKLGIEIPTLCYHKRLEPYGACRVCQVELMSTGRERPVMVAACTHPLVDGDTVTTQSETISEARRFILQLLLARSPQAKAVKTLADAYGVNISPDSSNAFEVYLGEETRKRMEEAGEEGLTLCMLCGLCTRVCREVVGRESISLVSRGPHRRVRPPFNDISPTCIGCGSCMYICPNDAIIVERA